MQNNSTQKHSLKVLAYHFDFFPEKISTKLSRNNILDDTPCYIIEETYLVNHMWHSQWFPKNPKDGIQLSKTV